MKDKVLKFIPLFLLIIASGILLRSLQFKSFDKEPSSTVMGEETSIDEKYTIPFTIDFGDGQPDSSVLILEKNSTAYDALLEFSNQNGLSIDSQTYDFGVFVKSIDGYESNNDKAWIYFVNSESGQEAADKYILSEGDSLEWKYVEPSY